MRKLLLLFAALVVAGCGEESSSEGSESVSKEPSNILKSLSDADIQRILKDALESYEGRKNGLVYQLNEPEPYSGWIKELYDSGQVKRLAQAKEGKEDGLWMEWHENGQKSQEGIWEDGKQNGLWMEWYEDGQKSYEGTWEDGKKNGLYTDWHKNGQRRSKSTYKDGEVHGLWTGWHENGQKALQGNCKYGERYGLWTQWHENGQKALQGTFKDDAKDGLFTGWHKNGKQKLQATYVNGEARLERYWNSKSEEVETWDEAEGKPRPVPPKHRVPLLPADAPDSLNTPGQAEEG